MKTEAVPGCLSEQLLEEYCSGALREAQLSAVESHLGGCARCQSALGDLALLKSQSQERTAATDVSDPPPPHRMPAVGTIIGGRYRVGQWIGKGGMGSVVAATHLDLERRVAIKFLHLHGAESLARFTREGRTLAQLKSPHIVKVYDAGQASDGVPYIVMELLEGCDLSAVVAGAELPVARAVHYVRQACAAVEAAHRVGIIHRDLKPSNIFLERNGDHDDSETIKVLDFGISKRLHGRDEPVPESLSITSTGGILGSPKYMSPEQLRASSAIDHRTDIWSLGLILYELLCGRHPFLSASFSALAIAIATEEPALPSRFRPTLPGALDAIIMRCLEKDPARRFQSVAELSAALNDWDSDAPMRERSRYVALGALGLAAAAFTLWSMRPAPPAAVSGGTATTHSAASDSSDKFLAAPQCTSCLADHCTDQADACARDQTCTHFMKLAREGDEALLVKPNYLSELFEHWWTLERQTGTRDDVRNLYMKCAQKHCLADCELGRTFACVGAFDWPAHYPSRSRLRMRIMSQNDPNAAASSWKIRACAPGTQCEQVMGQTTSDDRGFAELDLNMSIRATNAFPMPEFNGTVELDGGPAFYPQLVTNAAPMADGWYLKHALSTRESMQRARQPRGLPLPSASEGLVDVALEDCIKWPAWGYQVEILKYGQTGLERCSDCVLAYPDRTGTPDRSVTEMKSWWRGVVEIVLPAGDYAIAARDTQTQRLLAFVDSFEVRAGAEHSVTLYPASREQLASLPASLVDMR